MSTHDTNGRLWAKMSDMKEGMTIELDSGFTCHAPGEVEVKLADDGFYFECEEGRHYLHGQADDGEHLIGIYMKA
jgi:hypothetical protein